MRHDGGFDGEENEGERRVDQGSDGRAEITEAGAARQQIHVNAELGGVITDRQPGQKNQQTDGRDCPCRVGKAIIERNRRADGLQREKRNRAQRSIRNAKVRPATRAGRSKAKRVVLERLVGHPAVVIAADGNNSLDGHHVT